MPDVRRSVIAVFMFIIVGLIAATGTLLAYALSAQVPSGMSVSGWSIDKMSIPSFEAELKRRLSMAGSQQVVLQLEKGTPAKAALTMEQLGLSTNGETLLKMMRPLSSGSLWDRAQYRWNMRNRSLSLEISFDHAVMNAALMRIWPHLFQNQPADAKRIINPDDSISYIPETTVDRLDIPRLDSMLRERLLPLDAPQHAAEPVTVKVPLVTLSPKVTVETLKAQHIERKLIEFTTMFPPQNSEGRLHNVSSTAASIHDVVLKPDEIFDFSKFIQLTEAKYGYKDAPVIINGKLVPGIGGGICQVSSTLYNAVLRAGLHIVERRNHSLPVSYVPLGQDATYASGHINFRFQNTTGAHLLIRTSTTDKQMTVKLFGSAPANVTYDVESKTVKTLDPPVKYVHNPALPVGKAVLISKGKPGYITETYRVKKVDGQIVSRELVSKDTYSAQPTLFAANNGQKEEPSRQGEQIPPLVEDGIKGPVFR